MIELIFALVIIGIVLLSAPMLIQQSSQSNSVALQQEAIAAVASHTSILLTKHWDEIDANISSSSVSPILMTSVGDNIFSFTNNRSRAGIDDNITGRLTLVQVGVDNNISILNASTVLGQEGNDFDDIDDYHNTTLGLTLYDISQDTTASVGDYVDLNLTMTTLIQYIDDSPATFAQISSTTNIQNNYNIAINSPIGGTSNIKFVNVQLRTVNPALTNTNELNKSILLQAFSCNIGSVALGEDQK